MSKFDFKIVAGNDSGLEVHNPRGGIISPCTGKVAVPDEKAEYLLFLDLSSILIFMQARANLSQQTIRLKLTDGTLRKVCPKFKKEDCSGKI